MATYRYRKLGLSGYGEGRNSYAVDTDNFEYICKVEGKPGNWAIRGNEPEMIGPFKTREQLVDAYLRLTTFSA